MQLRTEINIKAPAEKIWSVLTDFQKYPEWNPMIKSFSGSLIEGSKVAVKLEQPGSAPMRFKPVITKVVQGQQFAWKGQLISSLLFGGEHFFEIRDNGNGTCTFLHGENFTGMLIPLLKKMLAGNTKRGFQLMNEMLKERCER
jgi:hypothetical protein